MKDFIEEEDDLLDARAVHIDGASLLISAAAAVSVLVAIVAFMQYA